MPKCNPKRIRQFLSHALSRNEEIEFEQHLSSCETCCRSLEDSTAEHRWWQDATAFLPDEVDDLTEQSMAVPAATDIDTTDGGTDIDGTIADGIPLSGAIQNVLQLLAPTDDPVMLGRLGSYEIAGVIGAGGMSVVLKGFDRSLNRYVAIKVLSPQLSTSGAARQRFAREAQAAAAVVHENVIAIHGVEEGQGLPYLVMPFLRGESLQARIDRQGPLGNEEILRIALQTATGLAAAHAKGLIHRDVKPANILLADGVERVTITDFGLARAADDASLTRSGMIAGTPQYMSPEQARGEAMDARSDLFSLGGVIYAMCTGRAPFRSETAYGVLRRITDSEPRAIQEINHQVPDWLCRIVGRLHAKQNKNRYASASDVAADLQQCLAHLRAPNQQPLPSWLRKSNGPPSIQAVGAGLSVLLLVLMGVTSLSDFALLPNKPAKSEQHADVKTTESNEPTEVTVEKASRLPQPPVEPSPSSPSATRAPVRWNDGINEQLQQTELEIRALEEQLRINEPVSGVPFLP